MTPSEEQTLAAIMRSKPQFSSYRSDAGLAGIAIYHLD
jgi:hypothetical protein